MEKEQPSYEETAEAKRAAYRMNTMVESGLVTAHAASTMEEKDFDAAVGEIFDAKFDQNPHHPEQIDEKQPGQFAEDIVIEQLNALGLFRVEHAPPDIDSGPQHADAIIHVEGFRRPIYVQLTTEKGDALPEKLSRLPDTTLPIIVPGSPASIAKRRLPNPENPTWFVKDLMRQLLDEMRRSPVYRPAFNLLWDRFAAAA